MSMPQSNINRPNDRVEMFCLYLIMFGMIIFFVAMVVDMAFGINLFITVGVIVGVIIVIWLLVKITRRLHPSTSGEGE